MFLVNVSRLSFALIFRKEHTSSFLQVMPRSRHTLQSFVIEELLFLPHLASDPLRSHMRDLWRQMEVSKACGKEKTLDLRFQLIDLGTTFTTGPGKLGITMAVVRTMAV